MLQDAVMKPAGCATHISRWTSRTLKQVNHIGTKVRVRFRVIFKEVTNSVIVGENKVKLNLRIVILQNFFKGFSNLETKSPHVW